MTALMLEARRMPEAPNILSPFKLLPHSLLQEMYGSGLWIVSGCLVLVAGIRGNDVGDTKLVVTELARNLDLAGIQTWCPACQGLQH